MTYFEEKLQSFTKTVMMEATQQREKILKEAQAHKKEILEQKELEFLEHSYETIQKEIRKVLKEKNEMISWTVIESKKRLFQKREEIVDEIFSNILKQIEAFKQTARYEAFLFHNLRADIRAAGEGEIWVYVNKTDMALADKLKQRLEQEEGISIAVLPEEYDMIGGCKVMNKTKNLIIDDSLQNRIQKQREQFLKTSGLVIE